MNKKLRIILAIVISIVIIMIPLTVMLVARNIDTQGTQNSEIVTPDVDAPSEEDKGQNEGAKPHDIRVTISISCSNLYNEVGREYLDDIRLALGDELYARLHEGEILANTEITIQSGKSVMDVMRIVSRDYDIIMNINNGYISSIAGLREKMAGKMSGWVYTVNDNVVNVGASGYFLKDGDSIKWFYKVGDKL